FPGYEPRRPNLLALAHPVQAMRTFMTFFLGDVVAYVSQNDNNIRRTVWEQMQGALLKDAPYSFIGHSLGGVIAFDFLFNLFDRSKLFDPLPPLSPDQIELLKSGFQNLFTMGSPVGLFMLRKGDLWDPAKTGERFGKLRNPIPESQRTWLNFWDRQDL